MDLVVFGSHFCNDNHSYTNNNGVRNNYKDWNVTLYKGGTRGMGLCDRKKGHELVG